MGWKLQGSPKTQKVTHRLAQEFDSMAPAPSDRPLSERRLQVYERLMREGMFRPITWAVAMCSETGGTYRVNGKHTSRVLSKIEPLPDLYITVERYTCDTLDDVARLYGTFDSKMQSRNVGEINASFAACVPELAHIGQTFINAVVSGMAFHKNGGVHRSDRQPAERAEALFEHHDFVVWSYDLLGGGQPNAEMMARGNNSNRHLKRAAVLGAMFGTYQRDPKAAGLFWSEVQDDSNPRPDAPSRKLSRYLLMNFGRGNATVKAATRYRITDREVYVKCLHAWNAYRKAEGTNLNYKAVNPVPKIA